jgi:outer membrane protein OmpU
MRKVLLTTTALVGLGGVSAASAIEISGQYEFNYTNADNGTALTAGQNSNSFSSDGNIDFKGSTTTDAGLTFGGMIRLQTNSQAAGIEDQGLYVSGDFGYIMMGQTDGVVDGMNNFMEGSDYVAYGAGTTNSTVNDGTGLTDNEGTGKIGYRSPNISGLQVGFSMEDAGTSSKADATSMMVTYDMGVMKVGYGSASVPNATATGADVSQTQYGVGGSVNGFTYAVAWGTDKTSNVSGTSGNSSKIDTSDFLIAYDMDNVSVYYNLLTSEEKTGTNIGDKMDSNEFGIYYTIAPGVSALLSQTASDYTDATTGGTNSDTMDTTFAGLTVKF